MHWKLEFVLILFLPSFDVDSGLSPGRTPLDYGTGRTPLEGYQVKIPKYQSMIMTMINPLGYGTDKTPLEGYQAVKPRRGRAHIT